MISNLDSDFGLSLRIWGYGTSVYRSFLSVRLRICCDPWGRDKKRPSAHPASPTGAWAEGLIRRGRHYSSGCYAKPSDIWIKHASGMYLPYSSGLDRPIDIYRLEIRMRSFTTYKVIYVCELMRIQRQTGPQHHMLIVRTTNRETAETEALCHSRRGTIKIAFWVIGACRA